MRTKRDAPARKSNRRPDGAARTAVKRPVDAPPSRRGGKRGATAPPPHRATRAARSGPRTAAMPGPEARPKPAKNAEQAKARAKARKAKAPKVVRPPLRTRLITRLASLDLRPRTLAAKVPFVVLVIGSLGLGLGLTLWLSTDAAERSYQLGSIRAENRALLQQKEALERDVLQAQSAPALAEAARNLGMVPSRDTAHLIQDPTGNWVVVGSPKPADGTPAPPLNTKLPEEQPAPSRQPAARPTPAPAVEVPVRVPPGVPPAPPAAGWPAPAVEVPLQVPGAVALEVPGAVPLQVPGAVALDGPPPVLPPVGPPTQSAPGGAAPPGLSALPGGGVEQFSPPLFSPDPGGPR